MADLYPVPAEWAKKAYVDTAGYKKMYEQSIKDPDGFWGDLAKKEVDWIKPFTKVTEGDFTGDIKIKWFLDGKLNVTSNCIDRHLAKRGDQVAIIWESDDPNVSKSYTYKQLHTEVCKFANVLKSLGVKKGDRVVLYLPMIPELAFAMLACARIGAVHAIVFGGFSADALATRIQGSSAKIVVTCNEGYRGGRTVPSKKNVDEAVKVSPTVEKVVVFKRTPTEVPSTPGRDLDWDELMSKASADCAPETMDSEDPFFILYTSGSTGAPKGALHTIAGYLLFAAMSHKYIFDYHDGDIYWCTADIGWVTGHSFGIYGPLFNGATTLLFEGIPNYPDWSRFWDVIDKHKVNTFYTAPTVIRSVMREGEGPIKKTSRKSLRLLASVGEPINPEVWEWYYRVIGDSRCPIMDTWWQTESGGFLIAPMPGATPLKPGSATWPFFGIEPALVAADGSIVEGKGKGAVCIKKPWPGILRTCYNDHERFKKTYFGDYPGLYFSGDGADRDADGYYWITGRVDDVINVSGHRMGTAEVESALVAYPIVAEAAVVGFPHDLKGQGIYAYVTLNVGEEPSEDLRKKLVAWVRKEIGPIASPDFIQWAPGLPKTRSGKIMRRILRKIAANELDELGDTSTLAEPAVVDDLVANRLAATAKK
jgi:acetyl-CoA synthetase